VKRPGREGAPYPACTTAHDRDRPCSSSSSSSSAR
jgi:hypothetical protein